MAESRRKPDWLKIKLPKGESYKTVYDIVQKHNLHTICTSGKCPNMGECWNLGTATFMILGDICTRSCKFCNTKTGRPLPADPQEPDNVAQSIRLMQLKHAVITSVDRDDMEDLGSRHWALTISKIKEINPETTIEVLIPDFQGKTELLDNVISSRPEIISHNLETVESLTPKVRSAAKYKTSLDVLKHIASSGVTAKSGIMLGLGETDDEILNTMEDILETGTSILTMGQYLQPTKFHLPVERYVHPDEFRKFKEIALSKGFKMVESGPLVRSSYHAEKHIKQSS
ncbi:lipoyl synthase [Saccharicrinis sp. FJH2]|uniref:lipoyl synthase n=1 Tax=Saccharicrinis sp. FJH65 TaxID=3344659 RepID=UPI0035F2DEAA